MVCRWIVVRCSLDYYEHPLIFNNEWFWKFDVNSTDGNSIERSEKRRRRRREIVNDDSSIKTHKKKYKLEEQRINFERIIVAIDGAIGAKEEESRTFVFICVWKMLARKMCGSENKMWIINIGLSVLLFVIAVQCYELELSREAAFQGMYCLFHFYIVAWYYIATNSSLITNICINRNNHQSYWSSSCFWNLKVWNT